MTLRAATLSGQFLWPLRRELCLLLGCAALASLGNIGFFQRESIVRSTHSSTISMVATCVSLLAECPCDNARLQGRVLTLVVGGLQEAICTTTGRIRLKLADRKGFCKLALEHG